MTSTSLRIRLGIALGIPLAACKSAPAPEPVVTPPTTTPPKPQTAGACAPDEIHERVCGLVDESYEGGGGQAASPHRHCTMNALPLTQVEPHHVLDGWKISSHDEVLASFQFDAAATASYKYEGSYHPELPRCCFARCNPLDAKPRPRAALATGAREYELCVPSPVSTKYPAATAKQCPAALRTRHTFPDDHADPLDDAPFARAIDDQCCYSVASTRPCPPNTFIDDKGHCKQPSPGGRPLREHEDVVVAPARARSDWSLPVTSHGALDGAWSRERRAEAADAWTREAAFEHASVAAFARLALELMAHGAPVDLVDAAHVAARDEIRHAQQCYGIAASFSGVPVGPGPLALRGRATPSLEELAVECFRDGCVGETIAALGVAEASRRVTSRELAATLAAIADDEARHAELSYRILAWALREGGPSLHTRIAEEVAVVRAELATVMPDANDADESIGILSPRTSAGVRRRGLADVVVPCTEALLAAQSS